MELLVIAYSYMYKNYSLEYYCITVQFFKIYGIYDRGGAVPQGN